MRPNCIYTKVALERIYKCGICRAASFIIVKIGKIISGSYECSGRFRIAEDRITGLADIIIFKIAGVISGPYDEFSCIIRKAVRISAVYADDRTRGSQPCRINGLAISGITYSRTDRLVICFSGGGPEGERGKNIYRKNKKQKVDFF